MGVSEYISGPVGNEADLSAEPHGPCFSDSLCTFHHILNLNCPNFRTVYFLRVLSLAVYNWSETTPVSSLGMWIRLQYGCFLNGNYRPWIP